MNDGSLANVAGWLVLAGLVVFAVCVTVYLFGYLSGRGWHRAKREHLQDLFLEAQRKDEVNGQG